LSAVFILELKKISVPFWEEESYTLSIYIIVNGPYKVRRDRSEQETKLEGQNGIHTGSEFSYSGSHKLTIITAKMIMNHPLRKRKRSDVREGQGYAFVSWTSSKSVRITSRSISFFGRNLRRFDRPASSCLRSRDSP
jgi:hypothetical protein